MHIKFAKTIAPFATASMTLLFASFMGCEKKPEVYTSRSADPAYKTELKASRTRQNQTAAVRARLVPQMEDFVRRARAALPEGATDDQVKAELDGNPAKYPGWRAASDALAKANADLAGEMKRARETVRTRILKEAADRRSVAAGKATARKTASK